jgi:hypothetical protein
MQPHMWFQSLISPVLSRPFLATTIADLDPSEKLTATLVAVGLVLLALREWRNNSLAKDRDAKSAFLLLVEEESRRAEEK